MAITIPQLTSLAQEAIPYLTAGIAPLAALSTDFSADVRGVNETVKVPVIGKPTAASAFSASTGYADKNDSTLTTASITLDTRLFTADTLVDTDWAALPPDTIRKLFQAQVENVAEQACAYVFAKATADAIPNEYVAGDASEFSYAKAVALKTAATKLGIPNAGRHLLLDSAAHDTLLADSTIASAFVAELAKSTIEEGFIRRVAGMFVHEAAALPDNDENLYGLLTLPSGIAVASRATEGTGKEDMITIITDPQTGFSIVTKVIADPLKASITLASECIFGGVVANADAIVRIVSAATSSES